MSDLLRLVLLLIIAGAALTAVGGLTARYFDPRRRLQRYLRQALQAEPEGVLIDRGGGLALAFNLEARRVSVLWDRGRKGLIYRLDQLMGGEMMVDHAVLARVYRDEPSKRLEQIPSAAHRIILRLIFDNPRDPEFELELWPARHGRGHEYRSPAEAVQAGRRWLASLEALLRRPAAARMLTKPAAPVPVLPDEDEPPPWDEDEAQED
jgi:hypothetical protein